MDAAPQIFRELGSMDARISNIEGDVAEVKKDLREISESVAGVPAISADLNTLKLNVQTLLERSAVERGARRILWKVGGASSAGGGLLVAVAQWVQTMFHRGG